MGQKALPAQYRRDERSRERDGRLLARPGVPGSVGRPGLHTIKTNYGRDALVYVPASYDGETTLPLALVLHGAGGCASSGLQLLQRHADGYGVVVLATASHDRTWDVIMGNYGPDVASIDRALAYTFSRFAVDPRRIAIGGFSDGASYALSLGLTNGDLFSHVIAFSPGFAAPLIEVGQPKIFVTHGKTDHVLPIDRCSRRLVPRLQNADYDVTYHEFDGNHIVPQKLARESLEWFTTRD